MLGVVTVLELQIKPEATSRETLLSSILDFRVPAVIHSSSAAGESLLCRQGLEVGTVWRGKR
jgi:hypothetical protein